MYFCIEVRINAEEREKKTKKTHIHHHSMFPEQALSLLAADKK